MGKLAGAGAFVLLGGGVSAGGVVLSGMFSFDSTLSEDLEDFQNNGHGEGCVQYLFPTLKGFNGAEEATSDENKKVKKSGFFEDNKKSETKGCLVINGDKEKYKGTNVDGADDKGKGSFRLLGSLKQSENKGFVVFASAKTTQNKELLGKGVAYALENKSGTWEASKKKTVSTEDKKFDQNKTDSKFPKFNLLGNNQFPFWGFIEKKEDLSKICGESDCTSGNKEKYEFNGYGTWKGEADGAKEVKSGTSSLSEGGGEVYGTAEGEDISTFVEGMKGQWEEKVWYGIDKPVTEATGS